MAAHLRSRIGAKQLQVPGSQAAFEQQGGGVFETVKAPVHFQAQQFRLRAFDLEGINTQSSIFVRNRQIAGYGTQVSAKAAKRRPSRCN
jgi:hypothetical protein